MIHGIRQRMGAASLIGPRDVNQDAYAVEDSFLEGSAALAVLAVADGMGGLEGGELASRAALDGALQVLRESTSPEALRDAFAMAHAEIRSMAAEQGLSGTGSTLTVALVLPGEAVVAHVGDTRAYILNGPRFTQITDDHSRVGRLVQSGVLSEEQAMGHPDQNVLERALGAGAPPEVDLYRVGLGPGDILLLCTDGLHGVLPRDELERGLRSSSSLQEACDCLVRSAEARGSQDNITALAWEYPAVGPAGERPTTVVQTASRQPGARSEPRSRTGPHSGSNELVIILGFLVIGFLLGAALGFLMGIR